MAAPATPGRRRLLLDTNVVIGALLWSGSPLALMEQAVEEDIELVCGASIWLRGARQSG